MTSPTGGGANLGTAFGKVRINYESTGSGRATKDVEAVQRSLVNAGKTADQTTKSLSSAAGQINQFAAQTAKLGKNVSNPVGGLSKQVENEVNKANRALRNVGKTGPGRAGRNGVGPGRLTITPEVKIDPRSISFNQAGINKLVSGTLTQAISLKVPLKIDPSDITIDQKGLQNIVSGKTIDPLSIKAPLRIEGSDVQIDTGSLTSAGTKAGNATGAAMGAGMLARLAPAIALTAAPVAALGFTLTQGFSRLQGLDNAAIKLKALGHSANEIKSISDSALKSVKGTSFGLDEAFNTAANAISSGIEPGEKLDKYLSAVSNTAALANVSMADLGQAFGQASAEGKLTGDILQLLFSRNIPILKLLAEEYGVTQAAARQMVSNSEIDFDRFLNAMSKNGDAAKIMGGTVSGSFKNMLASIKRSGAILLAPIFGEATGEASTMAKAIQAITGKLEEFEDFLKENKQGMITFWATLGELAIQTGHVVITAVAGMAESFGLLAKATSWVPRLLANFAELTGKENISRDLFNVADAMTSFGDRTREFARDAFDANGTLDSFWETVQKWEADARTAAKTSGELGNSLEEVEPKAISLREALEKYGVKEGSAISAIQGTVAEFEELIKALEKKPGSEGLISVVKNLRKEFDNGGRAAASLSDAIRDMSDQTIDASTKADALISSLQAMGLLPGGDALDSYNDSFRDLISYQANLVDALDVTGNALINLDGTVNTASGNGNKLKEIIDQTTHAAYEFAASQEAPAGEIYDETVKRLKYILEQFGIVGSAADDFINKNLSPGAQGKAGFEAYFTGKTPQEVLEEAFKNDPAKAATIIDLVTTRDDIINELTGGPNSTLKIPAEIDLHSNKRSRGWLDLPDQNGTPVTIPLNGAPGTPGSAVPELPKQSELPAPTPEQNEAEKPWWRDPFGFVRDHFNNGQQGSMQLVLPDSLANANDEEIKAELAKNEEIERILHARVTAAEAQGKNLSEAFAEGINSADEAVRNAIIRLAQLVGDGLGNSPAKYGPLSGRGWTYERGKVFTQAWAAGISSEEGAAKEAATGVAGQSVSPFGEGIETLISDLNAFSSIGKKFHQVIKAVADISFSIAGLANDFSGGRLFPKSYKRDPNFDFRRGSPLGEFSPTRLRPPGTPIGPVSTSPSAKGDEVAKAFIAKANSRGWNQEQILAGLGVLNQETAYGTNPATNNVQNQNGTPGITGVFQQDMSYRKYGDPRDVNNAIEGYITEFENRGGLTANPWDFAVSGVQKPANVGAGGYWDRSGAGAGNYLREKQRQQALETFNRLSGQSPFGSITSSIPTRPNGPAPEGKTWDYQSGSWIDVSQAFNQPQGALQFPSSGSQNTNSAIGFLEQYANQMGLTLTSGKRSWAGTSSGKSFHLSGEAGDFAIPGVQDPTPNKRRFAEFVRDNFGPYIQELIYSDDQGGVNLNSGKPFEYGPETAQAHRNHVHVAVRDEMLAAMQAQAPVGPLTGQPGSLTNLPQVELGPNSLAPLNTTAFNTTGLPGMPPAIEDLAKSNPQVLEAIRASQSGNITQEQAIPLLQSLDSAIADQNRVVTPQGKAISESLGRTRSQLMQQTGLTEGPSGLDQAMGIADGISGIVGSAFGVFDSAIASIASTKEISGTLVRGMRNTEDIYNIVDEIQSYIELGQNIAQVTSDVLGFAAGIVGSGAAGDTSGGTAIAAMALGAASSIAGIVSQVYAAANAYIDLGQEIYRMAGKYGGRMITNWVGLPGATDLKFLLDEVTGQLQVWTSENPQMKNTFNTLGRQLDGANRYGTRDGTRNEFHIYQGPGQDPRDTMSQAMFAVKTSGIGALGYAV